MVARSKPYDQFGPFILFKKLEADALGDLWRAARVENGQIGPVLALRRMSGGAREALASNARAVSQILPLISGASFVRDQQAGVVDGVPYVAWEYGGGRSLRHIMDCARGGKDTQAHPLPIDQAIVIAEKVALSLATMADLRDASGARLGHGALIPQFVWVSEDGEIRVGGQQLGSALIASFADPHAASDLGRYFSPEYRASGTPQKNTDVYSMGAILFLLVTGHEPPDAATASAFGSAVRAAKLATGDAIPADIRVILDKSLNLDPSMRYAAMADMKQALSALGSSGHYTATTFNLAFYLTTLLKKELEAETAEREAESKVNAAAYAVAPAPAVSSGAHRAMSSPSIPPALSTLPESRRSKVPLYTAAGLIIAGIGAAGWMMFMKDRGQPALVAQVATAQAMPVASAPQPIIAEPISITPTTSTEGTVQATAATAETATATDPASQKKAFEDAVRRKLEAEMLKLQNDYLAELQRQQSRNAPAVVASTPAVAAPVPQQSREENAPSAAQLDSQRRQETVVAEAPRTATVAPQIPAQTQTTAPVPAPAAAQLPTVREGDVVAVAALDIAPRRLQMQKPQYPPMALRQKIEATVFMTVLVTENGDVSDVRILRGEPRFGINDAAVRAMRSARFAPPLKDGRRVKTWMLQSIEFKQN